MTAPDPILQNPAKTDRVAVFVDGDNISADHADEILRRIRPEGSGQILRVYGNATKSPSWRAKPEFQFFDAGTGKNAADMLLCIDALEMGMQDMFDTAIIASSDGDFRHLAFALRARNCRVVGLGEKKAPETFRAACCHFEPLRVSTETSPSEMQFDPDSVARQAKDIIAEKSSEGMGAMITLVNSLMATRHGIHISKTKHRNWRAYYLSREHQFDIDPKGKDARVRFNRAGF